LVVAIVGAALGCLLGYVAHLGLLALLGEFITTELPSSSLLPALQGLVTGVWLLLGFALPSLAQLRTVPPVQVLRSAGRLPGSRLALGYLVGMAGFVLLLLWVAGNLALGLLTAGGFLLAFGLFAVLSWAGLACLAPLRRFQERQSVVWRFALAGLVRRRSATVAQICALSIGLMAMLCWPSPVRISSMAGAQPHRPMRPTVSSSMSSRISVMPCSLHWPKPGSVPNCIPLRLAGWLR